MSFYLGLDASTQRLSAVLIEAGPRHRAVVGEWSLGYDEALPAYGTRHGVLSSPDPLVAQSPPLVWVEALDRVMAGVAAAWPAETARLAAVGGSAQQHGSVYLTAAAPAGLEALDPTRPLVDTVQPLLARDVAPVWMDATTAKECRDITAALGGDRAVARLTGSRAFERFTGPQIRRFALQEPARYQATGVIHLVSSFLASLLAGRSAPIDPGDGSGMNLMDIRSATWSDAAVQATAPDLARKLPPIVSASTVIGSLAPYWCARCGYGPARVVVWSGDNPSSAIGTGLVREGKVAVSLGTSDTIFGLMDEPRPDPDGAGHVFGAPTGRWMGLTCFRNGSLARERVRDAYGMDWAAFSAALASTPLGNNGALMLPWFELEITPTVVRPGARRQDLDVSDAPANVRAVVEAQMMALANHSAWMGVDVDVVHATGGAAVNRAILQVMADVMDAEVCEFRVSNSAALGAALRAVEADWVASGRRAGWDEVVAGFTEPVAVAARPVPAHVEVYKALRVRYAAFERAELAASPPGARRS